MTIHHCSVCGSSEVSVFLNISQAPVCCNQLCHTRATALAAPVAEIQLGMCNECGHVRNVAFDPKRLIYSPGYENSLHYSPYFENYAHDLAAQLTKRYQLQNKNIIEIGCGRGDFLKSLCRNNHNRGFGFDPSHPDKAGSKDPDSNVVIYQGHYCEKLDGIDPDLICCRHCLEHIEDPISFLRAIRETIGMAQVPVFFEVPNVLFTLEDGGIWDIIYEHCSYFSPNSLDRAFREAGFRDIEISQTFQRQFLTLHALNGEGTNKDKEATRNSIDGLANSVLTFADYYQKKIADWKTRLQDAQQQNKKVVIWGAGSKGNTFLNTTNICGSIDYVVDINPYKQGKFVVGTGQEIVHPEFLRNYHPDTVIIMNSIYEEEIRKMVAELHLEVDFSTMD